MTSLDLGLIGNGTISGLVNPLGEIVWACFPRFDGDPTFCSLLRERTGEDDVGFYTVELLDGVTQEQEYLVNTPALVTRLFDSSGSGIEITDFARPGHGASSRAHGSRRRDRAPQSAGRRAAPGPPRPRRRSARRPRPAPRPGWTADRGRGRFDAVGSTG